MQTGNLDSGTNCTSPDKDKITSVNITQTIRSFQLTTRNINEIMTKTRKTEAKTRKKPTQKMQTKNFQI